MKQFEQPASIDGTFRSACLTGVIVVEDVVTIQFEWLLLEAG